MARAKSFVLKRWAEIALTVLGLSMIGVARADTFQVNDLAGGINDAVPGNLIADNQATSIVNFHVNPETRGLDQRRGSAKQNSTQLSGSIEVDVFPHQQSDGDAFLVSVASRTVSYSIDSGVTFTNLVTTMTLNSVWDGVSFVDDSFYMVNQDDGGWQFNGTAFATAGSMPAGKFVEAYQNRLFTANTSAFPYRVFFSGLLQPSTWTTSTDYFDMPEAVTCIGKPFDGGLPVYTINTTWMLRGTGPTNFYLQQISNTIGCAENRTVKNFTVKGVDHQIFLSLGQSGSRKSLYALIGDSVVDLGEEIVTIMDDVSVFDSSLRQILITLEADWEAGVFSGLEAPAATEDIRFLDTVIDNFSDNEFTSNIRWSTATYLMSGGETASFSAAAGKLKIINSESTSGGFVFESVVYATYPFTSGYIGTKVQIEDATFSSNDNGLLMVCVSSSVPCFFREAAQTGYYFKFGAAAINSAGSFSGGAGLTVLNASCDAQAMVVGVSTSIGLSVQDGVIRAFVDGVEVCNASDSTYSSFQSISVVNARESSSPSVPEDISFDDIEIKKFRGDWNSAHQSISASAFGTFSADSSLSGSTITYAIYSDTNTSITLSNSATWISSQTITSGATPSISTQPYVVFYATFTRSDPDSIPALEEIRLEYTDSSGTGHPPASEIWNNEYWMSYTSAGGSGNDSILVMNREGKFSTFDALDVFGFAVHNQRILAGTSVQDGTNGGYVWRLDTGTTDNGSAINSSVVFKHHEFPGDLIDWRKILSHAYFNYAVGVGTFTATVYENFSDDTQTKTVNSATGNTVGRYRLEADPGTTAKQLALGFANGYPGLRLRIYPPMTLYFQKQKVIPQ